VITQDTLGRYRESLGGRVSFRIHQRSVPSRTMRVSGSSTRSKKGEAWMNRLDRLNMQAANLA
jgi:hypothetical protein